MKTTKADPIIAEVHRVRDANGARFDYDVARIFQDIRERQEKSDRKYVRYPPGLVASRFEDGNAVDVDYLGCH